MTCTPGFFGRCIGRTAASHSGLNAVYLPPRLDRRIVEEVVREANLIASVQPPEPPFAILIADGETIHDDDVRSVGRSEAIRYRQGDRLAVVPSTSVDIASFDGAFREALGPGFPTTSVPGFDVTSLASTAVTLLWESFGWPGDFDSMAVQGLLDTAMRRAADLLAEEREGAASWTRDWFELVDRALVALANLPNQDARRLVDSSYQQIIEENVWSAFGLSSPSGQGKDRFQPKRFIEALKDGWSSEEQIDLLTRESTLAERPGANELEGCAEAGWAGLDEAIVREGSLLSGLQAFISSDADRIVAFSSITDPIFLGSTDDDAPMEVLTQDGHDAGLSQGTLNQLVVLVSELDGHSALSEPFHLSVPLHQVPAESLLEESNAQVSTSGARTSTIPCAPPTLTRTAVVFALRVRVPLKKPLKLHRVDLSIAMDNSDPLYGYLHRKVVTVYVLPPVPSAVVLSPWANKKRTKLGTPTYVGPDTITDDSSESGLEYREDLRLGRSYRVAYVSGSGQPATTSIQLEQGRRHGWWLGDLPADVPAQISSGEQTWQLEAATLAEAPQSLLLAAALGVDVSPEDPRRETMVSLRGQLEDMLARNVKERAFLEGLGHVALPTDKPLPVAPLATSSGTLQPQGPLLVAAVTAPQAHALMPASDPGPEWIATRDRFIESWSACISLLEEPSVASEVGRSTLWPSKRSARELAANGSRLEDMLRDYTAMMAAAQAEAPVIRFVAAFPFSTSGWRLGTDGKCELVMLSPWHPLRLAWLAAIEETLHEADRGVALMGSIEGWRFPYVAPGPVKQRRMIAVPIESGEADIFAVWAMMIPLAYGDEEPLGTPERLAGLPVPGSSASGLTASAADAAIRDFRRVNGHLPSVTIDLASSAPGQRMAELDDSVVRAAKLWSEGPGAIMGINVKDSTNRRGDLPRTQVAELLRDGLATSLSWSRYRPDPGRPLRSNLRLLQNSGVHLGLDIEPGQRNGAMGPVPLRRFEGPAVVSARQALLQPAIDNVSTPFGKALQAVEERNGDAPMINVEMSTTHLMADDADWSISGDAFVSSTILTQALSQRAKSSGHNRMLWEWRPPFLNPHHGSPLNRRPYASVMRVGQQLTTRIDDHIQKIDTDSPVSADSVFKTLGARGIGLSSLLTMGGHHAAGALGFYLTLRLLQLALPAADSIQAVMPIDSCRAYLDVLTPLAKSTETRRQADLLVIRANANQICLIPVEIKLYGVDGQSRDALPVPGSRFNEALKQLASTTTLLTNIQRERDRIEREGSVHGQRLWDNALTTLLEAAFRLNTGGRDASTKASGVLRRVASGQYSLSVGRPLITFFQHASNAPEEYHAYRVGDPKADEVIDAYGALAARPGLVLHTVAANAAPAGLHAQILEDWGKLLEWAEEHAVTPDRTALQTPADATADERPDEAAEESLVPHAEALLHDAPPDSALPVAAEFHHPEPDLVVTREVPNNLHDSRTPAPADPHAPKEAAQKPLVPAVVSFHATTTVLQKGADQPSSPATTRIPEAEPADTCPDGVRLQIGTFTDELRSSPAWYWPSNTANTQLNMGIVGDLGTGKTQLLKSLLVQLRHSARRCQTEPLTGLVFDYKRDFQDRGFVDSVGARVWKPEGIPLNVLELHAPYTKAAAYKRAAGFASMLERIYSGIGPVQRDRLITAILDLFQMEGGKAPTLRQVLDKYSADNNADAVSSILNGFVLSEIFSEDIGKLTSLDNAMRDSVLVVDLNSFGADHKTKNALVVLFLDMFYESMKRSTKSPFKTSPAGVTLRELHSFLLVDEASNIMEYNFPVLESLLKEGREFGVGTILSSQYLSHFKGKNIDFAESLSTWFVHKVPNVTSSQLSSLGIVGSGQAMADRIKQLHVHESLYKSDLSQARFIRETPFWQLMRDDSLRKY